MLNRSQSDHNQQHQPHTEVTVFPSQKRPHERLSDELSGTLDMATERADVMRKGKAAACLDVPHAGAFNMRVQ